MVEPLDQKLVRRIAHSLWSIDLGATSPDASPQERRTSWDSERRQYTKKARQFLRLLTRNNVEISIPETQSS